jgi:CRP-like cAMP-binding protein
MFRKKTTYENLLRGVEILSSLQPEEIRKLVEAIIPVEKEYGDVIISQDDNDKQYFYIIEKGSVDVTKFVDNREIHLHSLGPGDYFGGELRRGARATNW